MHIEQLSPTVVFKHQIVLNIWALTLESLSLRFANNKGTDQPAHPGSLIRAFCLSILATSKISIF